MHLALNEAPRYTAAEEFDPDVARAWNMIFGADTTAELDQLLRRDPSEEAADPLCRQRDLLVEVRPLDCSRRQARRVLVAVGAL